MKWTIFNFEANEEKRELKLNDLNCYCIAMIRYVYNTI